MMNQDATASDFGGSPLFRSICERLRGNDPMLYRVSLTTCYVDGVYDDHLCAALVHCLTCSAHVEELVLALSDQTLQPGSRTLAAWIRRQPRLRKLTLFSHGHSENTRETSRRTACLGRIFLDAAAEVEVVDIRLDHIEVDPLLESIYESLCRSRRLRKLRLTVTQDTAVVVSSDETWIRLKEGLRLNSTLHSVVIISPPFSLLVNVMQGLKHHASINSLVLDSIGDSTAQAFDSIRGLMQANTSLKHICLRKAVTRAVLALIEGLRESTSLIRVELEEVDFADDFGRLRPALSQNASLRELSLVSTGLCQEDFGSLVEYLTTTATDTHLRRLSVASNELEEVGSASLVRSLLHQRFQPSLIHLDLSGNAWGGIEGIMEIAAGLRDTPSLLEELNLASCQLGDEGVSAVAHSLGRNTTIRRLNFEYDQIGAEGARALVDLLRTNLNVEVLDLSFNSIGDEGISLLATFMEGSASRLKELNIADCEIEDEGLSALGRALERNTSIQTLRVDGNIFTDAGYESFARSLPNMAGLKHLTTDLSLQEASLWTTFAKAVHLNESIVSISQFDVDSQNLVIRSARDLIHFGLIQNRLQPLLDSTTIPDAFWSEVLHWPQLSPTPQWARVDSNVHQSVTFYLLRSKLASIVEKSIAKWKRKSADR